MRKFLMVFVVLVALLCGAGSAFSAEYAEGEVLVVLEVPQAAMSVAASDMSAFASSLSMQADSFANSVEAKTVDTYPEIARSVGKNIIHLRSDSKTTEQLIEELKNDPRVKSVSPNYSRKLDIQASPQKLPDDPKADELWGMKKIGADKVWDNFTGDGKVVVAVIDSGIWAEHPDLNTNMVKDSFHNYGRHFYNNGTEDTTFDPNVAFPDVVGGTHGTHVAGTIGAVGNNNLGVMGVNWKVGLLAANVFTRYFNEERKMLDITGYDGDIIKGINYVIAEKRKGLNIRVANMSLGGWYSSSPFDDAIKSMSNNDIIVVISAMNNAQNINDPTGDFAGKLVYPAASRHPSTISVGATSSTDTKSKYSNYSNVWVDIAAPGGDHDGVGQILSTVTDIWDDSGYGYMNGTSMAAPHVAGAAALLCMKYPTETAVQIRSRLLNSANKNVGVSDRLWARGRLDVKAAYDLTVPAIKSVTVSPKTATVVAGNTVSLAVEVLASSLALDVVWSARDGTGSVTVSGSGLVTGVRAGTATVTATSAADSTVSDISTVTVTPKTTSSDGGGCNTGYPFVLLLALPAVALYFRKRK